jgi:hypothetical protein
VAVGIGVIEKGVGLITGVIIGAGDVGCVTAGMGLAAVVVRVAGLAGAVVVVPGRPLPPVGTVLVPVLDCARTNVVTRAATAAIPKNSFLFI